MKIKVLREAGYEEALLGLSLSYNSESSKRVADTLAFKNLGHNKFLESIAVWIDMTAPRGFWQQYDTYRIGITKSSESTMHTILRSKFVPSMFENPNISVALINLLNYFRVKEDWRNLKDHLPESFLQRRIICTNYRVLQGMEAQRRSHKLYEWQMYLDCILDQVEYPEFIRREDE